MSRDYSRLLRTLNAPQETVIGRLLLVVVIEQQSTALTFEDTWNPGVLIGDTPDSHTNALLNGKASPSDVLPNCNLCGDLLGAGSGGV